MEWPWHSLGPDIQPVPITIAQKDRLAKILSFSKRINTYGPNLTRGNGSSKQSWENLPLFYLWFICSGARRDLGNELTCCLMYRRKNWAQKNGDLSPNHTAVQWGLGPSGLSWVDFFLHHITPVMLGTHWDFACFVNISRVIRSELFQSRPHVNTLRTCLYIQHMELHPHQAFLLSKHLDPVDMAEVS